MTVVSMIIFRFMSNSSFSRCNCSEGGFDLSVGMKNFQLSLVNVGGNPDLIAAPVPEDTDERSIISQMQRAGVTEGYILDDDERLLRRINLVNLLQPNYFTEEDELIFYEDQNLLEAIELASDFVRGRVSR